MFTGIDFSFSRVPPAVAAAAGHRFAISYLTDLDTSHRAKAWTAAEVQAYRAAGMGVVAVWQGGGADRTTAWRGGYDRGRRDARLAAQQSGALGRPEGTGGRPVYFAIDSDVSQAQLAQVSAYFDGIASVFDVANIGVYGGRRVIEWAMSSGKARWFWQTGAWSGGVRVPGIHLYQRVPETRLGPYAVDIDEAHQDDYGAWFNVQGGVVVPSQSAWVSPPRVTRSQLGWPASAAASVDRKQSGVKIHYLGTKYAFGDHSHCAGYVQGLRQSHLANTAENYSDIAYNELVCEHGVRFEGRGYSKRTGANGSASLNRTHYAICALLGSAGSTEPTAAQLHGLRDAIEAYRQYGGAGNEIKGHRDGYATSCPGGPLYAWVQAGAPRPGGGAPAPAPSTPSAQRRAAEVSVVEKPLLPGFDHSKSVTLFNVVSPPDSISVGCDMGDMRVRVDVFTNSGWHFVAEVDVFDNQNLAWWPLPADARKVAVKRVPRADGDTADSVPAVATLKYKPVGG